MADPAQQIIDTVKDLNPVQAIKDKATDAVDSAKDAVKGAQAWVSNKLASGDEPAVLMQPPPSAQAKFVSQHEAANNEALLRDYYQKHPEFAAADPIRAKRLGITPPPAAPPEEGTNPSQLAPGQKPEPKAQREQEQTQIEGRGGSEAEPAMVDPAQALVNAPEGALGIAGNIASQIGAGYAQKAAGKVTANPVIQTAAGVVGGIVAGGVTGYRFPETPEQLALAEENARMGAAPHNMGPTAMGETPRSVTPETMYTTGTEVPGKNVTPGMEETPTKRLPAPEEATAGAGEGAPVAGKGGKPAAQEAAPASAEAQPESVGAAALDPQREMEADLSVNHTIPDLIARAQETPLSKDEFYGFQVNKDEGDGHYVLTQPINTVDALRISHYTGQEVGNLQQAAKLAAASPDDELLGKAFMDKAAEVRDEILPRWLGMRHQIGMALRVLGKPTSNMRNTILNTNDILSEVDFSQPGQLMHALANLNPEQQTKLLRQAGQAGFWQHLTTLMRAAKLSPGTAVKKTASDLMMLAYTPLERGVATAINQIPGAGDQSMSVNQWLAMMHGYAQAIPRSRALAAASERADTPLFDQQMAFGQAAHKALGSAGTVLEGTPLGHAYDFIANLVHEQGGRRIIYPDQFAKNMHYEASRYAQAMEAAEAEGGAQGYSRAAYEHFLENPTPEMQERAYDDARARTFSNSLQSLQPLGRVLSTTPAGKATFPFVTTPINLMSFGLQNTPLAPLSRAWQRMYMAGGAQRSIALARMTIGTGLAWGIAHLWMQGKVHGDLSDNPEVRKLQINEGHQPNSITLGDRSMEMGNLPEPWGQVLSHITNTVALATHMPVDFDDPDHTVRMQQAQNIGSALVLSLAHMVHETSYFRTASDLMNIIGTDKASAEDRFNALTKLGADIVTPAAIEDIAHWWDPVKREVHGMIDQLKNNIPGWSATLPPQLDMFGRPVTYSRGSSFLNMGLSATAKMTSVDNDPVSDELIRLQHPMPPVPKALGGPARGGMSQDNPKFGVPLSPTERAAFTKLRGQMLTNEDGQNLHAALAYRMDQPDWKQANDIERRQILDQIYTQYQGMAKEWMMEHAPGLRQRLEHRQQQRAQMMGVQ